MAEFLIAAMLFTLAVALLAAFIPSIRLSAARKRAGDSEVVLSTWRDWNGDGTTFSGFSGADVDLEFATAEFIEPDYGVIRIQAR